jgi:hypothetical protein
MQLAHIGLTVNPSSVAGNLSRPPKSLTYMFTVLSSGKLYASTFGQEKILDTALALRRVSSLS